MIYRLRKVFEITISSSTFYEIIESDKLVLEYMKMKF
jgi:hypothetical protein